MVLRDPDHAQQLLIYVGVAVAAIVVFSIYAYSAG
jgi:hypothetical protein